MNRRGFLGRLTAVLGAAAVAITHPGEVAAIAEPMPDIAGFPESTIKGWVSYNSIYPDLPRCFDKELVENLKAESTVFEQMAQRKAIPISMGQNRTFFQYSTLSQNSESQKLS